MSYIGSSRYKYAPYLTIHFNRTDEFSAGSAVTPWEPSGIDADNVSIAAALFYGLWRMDEISQDVILKGIGIEWMSDLPGGNYKTYCPRATGTGDNATITATGIFATSLRIGGSEGNEFFISQSPDAIFPYTNEILHQSIRPSSPTKVTIEYFFKIIDTLNTSRICLFARGNHVYYNGNHSRILLNAYPDILGQFSLLELLIAYGNGIPPDGGYYSNQQQRYAGFSIGKNIADGNWHHIAIVKPGALAYKVFIDGEKCLDVTDTVSDIGYTPSSPNLEELFFINCMPNHAFTAYVDTLRIVTKELYTTDFRNPVTRSDLNGPTG